MDILEMDGRHVRRRLGMNPLTFVVVLMTGFVLAMLAPGSGYAQVEGAVHATLTVDVPVQVAVGEVIVVKLWLDGAEGGEVEVGGFEAQILYDHEAGEFAGFSPLVLQGDQALGRMVVPELVGGSAVGFYTCGTAPCLTLGELQAQAATTPRALAEVELLPLTAGQLEIKVDHVQVVDRAGQRIVVTLPQASVMVQVGDSADVYAAPASTWAWSATSAAAVDAAATDVTEDGQVAHSDVMETALSWQIERENGTPCGGRESAADVNRDSCVDIVDVQLAAAFADGHVPATPGPEQLPERLFLPFTVNSNQPEVEAAALTFVVNSTLDEHDAYSNDKKCLTPSGVCTLRAAIQQANAVQGVDTIQFAIPGNGVQTIQLASRLPTLWDSTGGTILDGYSQPGAAPNTDPLVSNAQIRVQIRGVGSGTDAFDALAITSANNVVKGLAFYNMKRSIWIYGSAAHDNVIVGNFLGIDAAGGSAATSTSTQQAHGVHIEQGAKYNRIGGVQAVERNIISGNARHGIGFWHGGTNGNVVLNNVVGLSPDGARRLSNRVHGVDMNYGASYNIVGGTQPGERNVISGNNGSGAEVSHTKETSHNLISGNFIGTAVNGNTAGSFSANGLYGISIKDRVLNNTASDNVVGNNLGGGVHIDNFGNCCTTNNVVQRNRIGIGISGGAIGNALYGVSMSALNSQIGPGNIIAYNPVGVRVEGDTNANFDGNKITQNSIFANTGLGIDISPIDQVNVNDADDLDAGPNEQLNFPVLQKALPTLVTGTACVNCVIEVFIADSGANAYGEGKTLIGTGMAASDGKFSVTVGGAVAGNYVTATATDAAGNTSEFSLNRVVSSPCQSASRFPPQSPYGLTNLPRQGPSTPSPPTYPRWAVPID